MKKSNIFSSLQSAVSTTQPIILDDHLASVPPESNSYLRQKEKLEYDHAKQFPDVIQTLFPALGSFLDE